MFAHIVACTGWTWDYVGEHIDIPRLLALKEYWAENPPVHMMVKAYLGIGKKEEEKPGNLGDLLASIPEKPGAIQ